GEAGRVVELAQQTETARAATDLFFELSCRGGLGRFTRYVALAGRHFEEGAPGRDPVLAHQERVARVVDGHDHHRAGMADDVPDELVTVGSDHADTLEGEESGLALGRGVDDSEFRFGDHTARVGSPISTARAGSTSAASSMIGSRGRRPSARCRAASTNAAN